MALDTSVYDKIVTPTQYMREAKQFNLSQELGADRRRASEQEFQQNERKMQAQKAVQYLSMATPENWNSVRSKVVQEGLATEQEIPPAFDANWNDKVISALGGKPQSSGIGFKVVGDQIVQLNENTGEVTPVYNAPAKPAKPTDPFKNANTLRDEFNTLGKDFRTVQDAYSKIMKTTSSGAGDMSMLYQYVKLLDPGSVVRESEFATAAASGSLGERIQGAYKSIAEGGRLPPALRQEFLNEAKNIYDGQKQGYDRLKKTYTDLSKKFELDPSLVITDYTDFAPSGNVSNDDPRVKQALEAGYTMEEIQQYLGGQ